MMELWLWLWEVVQAAKEKVSTVSSAALAADCALVLRVLAKGVVVSEVVPSEVWASEADHQLQVPLTPLFAMWHQLPASHQWQRPGDRGSPQHAQPPACHR